MTKITRRQVVAGGVAASSLGIRRARAQNAPYRIGFLAPLSGPGGPVGLPIKLGAEVARDHINKAGGVNGKPIEIVFRDDHTNPNDGVAAVREFAGMGVNLIIGPPNTAVVFAVMPLMPELKTVTLISATPDEKITHDFFNRNTFTMGQNGYTRLHAVARTMAQKYPDITSWTACVTDNAAGRNGWASFTHAMATEYDKVAHKKLTFLEPTYAKFGSTDYKPNLAQLLGSPATGLFTNPYGADGITFYQQYNQMGTAKKFKAVVEYAIDIELPKVLKHNTPLNIWCPSYCYLGAYPNNPMVKEIVAASTAAGDPYPHGYTALGYSGVAAYAMAIKAVQSTDTDKIIAALEGNKFDSPRGPSYFRKEDHQLISRQNMVTWAPSDKPPGWRAAEIITVEDIDIINPPAPGKKWEE